MKLPSSDLWLLDGDWNGYLVVLKIYGEDSFGRHESGIQGVCVYGAYMASSEIWAKLIPEWRRVLDADPKIEYFRMREVIERSGQFQNMPYADAEQKLNGLVSILERWGPGLAWLDSIITWDAYDHGLTDKMKSVIRGPSYFGIAGIIIAALAVPEVPQAFRFTFDEIVGLQEDVLAKWTALKTRLPDSLRSGLLSIEFADDRQMIPLQCADLLAWHVRRKWLEGAAPDDRAQITARYSRLQQSVSGWKSTRWNEVGIREHLERFWVDGVLSPGSLPHA